MIRAVASLTSTGFGDVHAATTNQQAIAFVTMLVGQILFGLTLAIVASTLVGGFYIRCLMTMKVKLPEYMCNLFHPRPIWKAQKCSLPQAWWRSKHFFRTTGRVCQCSVA